MYKRQVKVSVDDNTLDLTEGTLNDKFYSEIRTSAFAVSKDDSPLYRRFNNAALGAVSYTHLDVYKRQAVACV